MPFRLPADMNAIQVFDDSDSRRLGPPFETAIENWNRGEYPSDPGRRENLPIYGRKRVLIENGYGQLMPSELTVSVLVRQKLYFWHIPVTQLSGFRDELSGAVNAFSIGLMDPNDVEANWTQISSIEELPPPVMMRLIGLMGSRS